MSCDLAKATEGLENELYVAEVTERLENEHCYDYNYELCSFSNLSVTSHTSQLILQPFRRFTYGTDYSTLPLLYLRHSSFSYPSFASPTSQALHLRHLTNRPCISTLVTKFSQNIVADTDKIRLWLIVTSAVLHSFLLSNPTLLKSLPVSWKRPEQVAVSSYSS